MNQKRIIVVIVVLIIVIGVGIYFLFRGLSPVKNNSKPQQTEEWKGPMLKLTGIVENLVKEVEGQKRQFRDIEEKLKGLENRVGALEKKGLKQKEMKKEKEKVVKSCPKCPECRCECPKCECKCPECPKPKCEERSNIPPLPEVKSSSEYPSAISKENYPSTVVTSVARKSVVVDYSSSCTKRMDHLVTVDSEGRVHVLLAECSNFLPLGKEVSAYLVGDLPSAPWLSHSKKYPLHVEGNELVSEKGVAGEIRGKRFTVVQYEQQEIVWAAYSGITAPEVITNPDQSKALCIGGCK